MLHGIASFVVQGAPVSGILLVIAAVLAWKALVFVVLCFFRGATRRPTPPVDGSRERSDALALRRRVQRREECRQ